MVVTRTRIKSMDLVLTCQQCGKRDKTVRERECGYQKEINNISHIEVICDECEHEHLMDI